MEQGQEWVTASDAPTDQQLFLTWPTIVVLQVEVCTRRPLLQEAAGATQMTRRSAGQHAHPVLASRDTKSTESITRVIVCHHRKTQL